MVKIPDFLKDKLINAPESSYGVVTVTVILKSGKKIEGVEVSWDDEIIRCKGRTDVPFSSNDIADIQIQQ